MVNSRLKGKKKKKKAVSMVGGETSLNKECHLRLCRKGREAGRTSLSSRGEKKKPNKEKDGKGKPFRVEEKKGSTHHRRFGMLCIIVAEKKRRIPRSGERRGRTEKDCHRQFHPYEKEGNSRNSRILILFWRKKELFLEVKR